jgi:hypothetical protein
MPASIPWSRARPATVTGASGTASDAGYLSVGSPKGQVLIGSAFTNPLGADIHLIVHDHDAIANLGNIGEVIHSALVLGDLLIGALLGSGGIGITSVLATTTILVSLYLRYSAPAPLLLAQLYGVVLVVLAALVAVPALLSTIHLGFGMVTGLTIVFDLAYWVGAGVMVWGALVHWRSAAR